MMRGDEKASDMDNDRWCILRTAGPRTLLLWRSLVDAGIDAWTPVFVERRRAPRSKVVKETDTAGMPTFVFVRQQHRADLARLLLPHALNPHPPFSLFRYFGKVVTIRDRELHRLREIETERDRRAKARQASERKRLKLHAEPFEAGDRVRLETGMFGGLDAVIEASDGRHTMVVFGAKLRVEIETLQLREQMVNDGEPEPGAASLTDA